MSKAIEFAPHDDALKLMICSGSLPRSTMASVAV